MGESLELLKFSFSKHRLSNLLWFDSRSLILDCDDLGRGLRLEGS